MDGKIQTYEYKLLNVLIQGSAADCTKEAVLNYDRGQHSQAPDHQLLLTVHDELLAMCPKDELDDGQFGLRMAMESVQFDVPMLSEGYWSDSSWADLKEYDKKGVQV